MKAIVLTVCTRCSKSEEKFSKKDYSMNQREYEYRYAHYSCAVCGRGHVEFHHCIYHRMAEVPELNCPENLLAVCKRCHAELHAEGYSGRCRAWNMKCKEFGVDHMRQWHEGLPMKTKERFE